VQVRRPVCPAKGRGKLFTLPGFESHAGCKARKWKQSVRLQHSKKTLIQRVRTLKPLFVSIHVFLSPASFSSFTRHPMSKMMSLFPVACTLICRGAAQLMCSTLQRLFSGRSSSFSDLCDPIHLSALLSLDFLSHIPSLLLQLPSIAAGGVGQGRQRQRSAVSKCRGQGWHR